MKRIFTIILFLLFAVFALTLNLKNPDSVTLRYYFGFEQEFDLFLVLLIPFTFGVVLGVLLMSLSVMKNKVKLGKARRDVNKLEKAVEGLQAEPANAGSAGDSKELSKG